jgi:GAF domain-containing protein
VSADDQHRDDPFRWLLDAAATLVSSPTQNIALDEIARAVGVAMNVPAVDIESYDAAGDRLTVEATFNPVAYDVGLVTPLADMPNMRRAVIGNRTEELHADSPLLSAAEKDAFSLWGYRSMLATPLIMADENLGLLEAAETRFDRRFMATEHERFTQLAGLVAHAMHNRRAFLRFERQGRRLEALFAVGAALTRTDDVRDALTAAVTALAGGLGASWAALFESVRDGDAPPELVAAHGAPEQIAVPSRSSILRGIDPVVVSSGDPAADPQVAEEMLAGSEQTRLYLPLSHQDLPIGLLVMAWRDAQAGIGEGEIDFAHAATALLAATLAGLPAGAQLA